MNSTASKALARIRKPIPFGKTALVLLGVAGYWLLYWSALEASPLGRDLDFDGDGNISLLEALDGAELHSIKVVVDGHVCTEYFAPKTGSTWRVKWPK